MGMPDFPFGNGFAFPFQDNRRSAAVGEPFRLDVIRFKRGASRARGMERAGRMPGSRKNADRMEIVSLNSVWKAISLFL